MNELNPYGVSRGMNYWPNGVAVQKRAWGQPNLTWKCNICGIGAWDDWDDPDPNWQILGGLTGAREHNCTR